jgi:hypothetical protein
MGTHLFFEKDESAPVDELYCKCESYYQFREKTNKMVKMSRVLIQENTADAKAIQDRDIPEIKDQLEVQRTYQQALNLLLLPGREPPRTIPAELNCEHLLTQSTSSVDNNQMEEEQSGPLSESN